MSSEYTIQITRSWRKSLSMSFDRKGVLQVKAPKFCMPYQVQAFLDKNQVWIEREYSKLQERSQNKKYYLFGEKIEKQDADFYKKKAKEYIVPRCKELAEEYGFSFYAIRITSASTRWGSCSSRKTLNFSYRLVMAPKDSIDYVIIHELCHLREMNHSAKFWSHVASFMPNYKVYEKHLKDEWWKYSLV